MHAGRMPTPQAVRAHNDAKSAVGGLGLRNGSLLIPNISAGMPVIIELPEASALLALLLRIVVTIDVELAMTLDGEAFLPDYWRSRVGKMTMLSTDPQRRLARLSYLNSRAGLPLLASGGPACLYKILRSSYLVA